MARETGEALLHNRSNVVKDGPAKYAKGDNRRLLTSTEYAPCIRILHAESRSTPKKSLNARQHTTNYANKCRLDYENGYGYGKGRLNVLDPGISSRR